MSTKTLTRADLDFWPMDRDGLTIRAKLVRELLDERDQLAASLDIFKGRIQALEMERDGARERVKVLEDALGKVDEIACRSTGPNHPEDVPEPANRDGEELHDVAVRALSSTTDGAPK